MAIDKKLIDQLLTDYKRPEDIIGENGLLKELTKAILERAVEAEMTYHLGYEKHDPECHRRETRATGKAKKHRRRNTLGDLLVTGRPSSGVTANLVREGRLGRVSPCSKNLA